MKIYSFSHPMVTKKAIEKVKSTLEPPELVVKSGKTEILVEKTEKSIKDVIKKLVRSNINFEVKCNDKERENERVRRMLIASKLKDEDDVGVWVPDPDKTGIRVYRGYKVTARGTKKPSVFIDNVNRKTSPFLKALENAKIGVFCEDIQPEEADSLGLKTKIEEDGFAFYVNYKRKK